MRTFEKYANLNLLWIFPVIVPLGTILLSFYLQEWYWGLMDDASILGSGSNFTERLSYFYGMASGSGLLRPTYGLHSVVFYTLFEHAPVLMHVLKWIEAILTLLLWGLAARRISGAANTLPIFLCIALSFHYFYDSFFFLSTHDVLGLLFMGGALNMYLAALDSTKPVNSVLQSLLGVTLMFVGFGAKEPLVTCGVAFGISFLVLAQIEVQVRGRALFLGGSLLTISILYGFTIKLIVQGGYTSSYSFTNYSRMLGNLFAWVNKDLFNHSPWLVLICVLGWRRLELRIHHSYFFSLVSAKDGEYFWDLSCMAAIFCFSCLGTLPHTMLGRSVYFSPSLLPSLLRRFCRKPASHFRQ
ncbi:hypothetical protein EMGBS3_07160 [Anaerolineaceae bacterium]|nr:hypothetical protein EMGBS3_07160 [Anaerolineaceae bacterium]